MNAQRHRALRIFAFSVAQLLFKKSLMHATPSDKVYALFILGHAGTGKSWLTHRFVSQQHEQGRSWCVLDKDVVSEVWTGPLLAAHGQDPDDRDSPFFKEVARDLGYQSTLRVGRDQIDHDPSVVFPGPWSRELASGAIFSPEALGLPARCAMSGWIFLWRSASSELSTVATLVISGNWHTGTNTPLP